GDGHVDGLARFQGGDAVVDHVLGEHGAYRVVEQRVRGLVGQVLQGVQGQLGGGVTGSTAGQDAGNLGRPRGVCDLLGIEDEPGVHHHDDLVDLLGPFEQGDGVLEDGLSCDLEQLLGGCQTDALTTATGQDNGDGTGRPGWKRMQGGVLGQDRLPD